MNNLVSFFWQRREISIFVDNQLEEELQVNITTGVTYGLVYVYPSRALAITSRLWCTSFSLVLSFLCCVLDTVVCLYVGCRFM